MKDNNSKHLSNTHEESLLNLQLDVKGLSASQKRLIFQLNSSTLELLSTHTEKEFFEKSSNVVQILAAIINDSSFCNKQSEEKNPSSIPYAKQAIEYAIDELLSNLKRKQHTGNCDH